MNCTDEKCKIFLVHFAGGNGYSFNFLKDHLPEFEFLPLELPGRGKRMNESLLTDFQEAARDIFGQIRRLAGTSRFVIYGHSMGAYLALKVTSMLEDAGLMPLSIIVSGNAGPGIGDDKKRHLMKGQMFKDELKDIGGMPEEILSDAELFNFFEPILRADFEIVEKCEWSTVFDIVSTPIYAVMGCEEDCVSEIANWSKYCSSKFESEIMTGGHFFIYSHAERLAGIIKRPMISPIPISDFSRD